MTHHKDTVTFEDVMANVDQIPKGNPFARGRGPVDHFGREATAQALRLIHLNVGGPTQTIEHAGRTWRFEEHGHFGPLVLRRDGAPVKRQPGARSPFWEAYAAWRAKR